MLDPLGDYGGMTETHRLQSGSPAIDKGASFGENTDQRGFVRPFDKAGLSRSAGRRRQRRIGATNCSSPSPSPD